MKKLAMLAVVVVFGIMLAVKIVNTASSYIDRPTADQVLASLKTK